MYRTMKDKPLYYVTEAAEERASLSNVPPNYSEPMCVPEFADRYSMLQGIIPVKYIYVVSRFI